MKAVGMVYLSFGLMVAPLAAQGQEPEVPKVEVELDPKTNPRVPKQGDRPLRVPLIIINVLPDGAVARPDGNELADDEAIRAYLRAEKEKLSEDVAPQLHLRALSAGR